MTPLERQACRTSLYRFIKWAWELVDPAPFVESRHVWIICKYLEAVTRGEIPKLMINIPPGHQKSLTVSVFWPVWVWLQLPQRRFMNTCYRGDLALRDADRARDLIRSPEFQTEFGDAFALRKGQDVKSRYSNDRRGYRFSTPLSGIMGEGGDFVTLDDPHNVDEAESDEVRDDVVRRIRLALPTRVRSKRGGVVVMMQRLHSRDFCGVVLSSDEKWVHLCLPARFEPDHPYRSYPVTLPSGLVLPGDWRTEHGELLWPGLYDEPRLLELEESLGEYGAAGQLQQRPVPREGGLFKREWFKGKYVDLHEVPEGGTTVRGWDLGASTDKRSPYSAGGKVRKVGKRYYIMHMERLRKDPLGVKQKMRSLAEEDGPRCWVDFPQDPAQAGKDQRMEIAAHLDGLNFQFSPESGDKVLRAEALASQAKAGNVYIVRGDWVEPMLGELCLFPGGTYADQVDALSRAYHGIRRRAGVATQLGQGGELMEG